jgi:hypothetical protein
MFGNSSMSKNKAVSHFSCGATSAIATAIALREFEEVEIIYADTGSEPTDNHRFLMDCQEWFGQEIVVVKSEKYNNIFEVFERERILTNGPFAPCTRELKKKPIRDYLGPHMLETVQVWGFDASEVPRYERFKVRNPELTSYAPLIKYSITHTNALALLNRFDIKLPDSYMMGYKHANCIGCVKAKTLGYWAAIRNDYPDVFDKISKLERELKRTVIYGTYLDELDKGVKIDRDVEISCGYSCGQVGDYVEGLSDRVMLVEDLKGDELDKVVKAFFT